MNFNIRILYWIKPLKTQEKLNNYDTKRHTQISPLINQLIYRTSLQLWFSQRSRPWSILAYLVQDYNTHLYSIPLPFSRCSPWPTSSTNSKHRKDWFRNRWKMCNFLKYPFYFFFFAFARQVIGALFFLVYLKKILQFMLFHPAHDVAANANRKEQPRS